MQKTILILASFFGLIAVMLGAFAAHGLENMIDEARIETFQTGVRYQFYHTFGLIAIYGLYHLTPDKILHWAGICFVTGILCFSGSIYLLATREVLGITAWSWLGPVTPLGGIFFMIGWALLGVFAYRREV